MCTERLLTGLDDTSRRLVQCRGISIRDIGGVMSHPRSHLVHIEYRRQFLGLSEMDLAGCDHIVVDDTVRIDRLIYRLPLFGIGFDAELDRLHH